MSGLERLEKLQLIVDAAVDRRAETPVVLDVREVSSFADSFVILSGRSDRQVRAIADGIARRLRDRGERPSGVEGLDEGRWVLLDCGDTIVHVFAPEVRELYDLERLWSDAVVLEIEVNDRPDDAQAEDGAP